MWLEWDKQGINKKKFGKPPDKGKLGKEMRGY
jgi:hypothetical protein